MEWNEGDELLDEEAWTRVHELWSDATTKGDVFRLVEADGRRRWTQRAEAEWSALKRKRLEAKKTSSLNSVTLSVQAWARDMIYSRAKHLPCPSDFRIGRTSSKGSMRRFRRERSCCGQEEWTEVCPVDGIRYALGFNYGH